MDAWPLTGIDWEGYLNGIVQGEPINRPRVEAGDLVVVGVGRGAPGEAHHHLQELAVGDDEVGRGLGAH